MLALFFFFLIMQIFIKNHFVSNIFKWRLQDPKKNKDLNFDKLIDASTTNEIPYINRPPTNKQSNVKQ